MKKQELDKWEVTDLVAYKDNLHHRINQLRKMTLVCERQNINLQGELNQLKEQASRLQSSQDTFYNLFVGNSKKLAEGIKNMPKPHMPSKEVISENVVNLKNNIVEKGIRVKDSLVQTGEYVRKRIWGDNYSNGAGLREKDDLQLPGAKNSRLQEQTKSQSQGTQQ